MAFGRPKRARDPLEETALLDYAIKSLAARMQSERDLRQKLLARAEPGPHGAEAVTRVLQKLRELNYLNDQRYAQDFAHSRQQNRAQGRRRVQQDLQAKGIRADLATAALDATYENLDETVLVLDHIARKRLPAPTDEKSTARILRRLSAAGFSTKSIFAALRQLRSSEVLTLAEEQATTE